MSLPPESNSSREGNLSAILATVYVLRKADEWGDVLIIQMVAEEVGDELRVPVLLSRYLGLFGLMRLLFVHQTQLRLVADGQRILDSLLSLKRGTSWNMQLRRTLVPQWSSCMQMHGNAQLQPLHILSKLLVASAA